MAYYQSPASRIFSEAFSGPNKQINIVTAISIVNALIIFGILYALEHESRFLEFFITFRTFALALIAYKFRTGLKRDFGKFICIVNIIIAVAANYLVYNGDINDSGWEIMDELIIEKASEKVSNITDENPAPVQKVQKQQVSQPAPQATTPPANQYPVELPSLKKLNTQIQQPQPLRQGYSIGD